MKRFEEDGRSWIRLFNPSREFAVDVERLPHEVGEIRPADPAEVWKLVLVRDKQQFGDRATVGEVDAPRPP